MISPPSQEGQIRPYRNGILQLFELKIKTIQERRKEGLIKKTINTAHTEKRLHGSKIVPFSRPGQVDSPSTLVTSHFHLHDEQGCRQVCCRLNRNNNNQDLPRANKI